MNDLLEGCKVEIDGETFLLQETPFESGVIDQVFLGNDPAQLRSAEHEFLFTLFKGKEGWRAKRSANQTGRELLLVQVVSEAGLQTRLDY